MVTYGKTIDANRNKPMIKKHINNSDKSQG